MNYALGDALAVEVGKFFYGVDVVEDDGAVVAHGQGVFVGGNGGGACGGGGEVWGSSMCLSVIVVLSEREPMLAISVVLLA